MGISLPSGGLEGAGLAHELGMTGRAFRSCSWKKQGQGRAGEDGGCRKGASPSPSAPRSSDSSGGPSTCACPSPTPKRVHRFEEPVAPGVQCRHLSARTAGLWSHKAGGGAPRVGQHLPPTAGPGPGGVARPGHSSPSSQSIGAGTLRRLHPRACCSRGDCGRDEGQGDSPGLQVLAPRGWPLLSRLGQCLPHVQRGEHSAPALAEAGAHSRRFIGTSFQDGVP